MDTNDLLKEISAEKYYIWGTGFVANRFFDALNNKNLLGNLIGIIDCYNQTNKWRGYPVYNGKTFEKKYNKEPIYCAVHYVNYQEIVNLIPHFFKMRWIGAHIFDLEFGTPLIKNTIMGINDVICGLTNIYSCSIYYMMIDDVVNKRTKGLGIEAYRKFQRSFNNEETVIKKERLFIKRILEYRKNKEVEKYAIKLNREKTILLDGMHRLSLAEYFGEKTINCDIYPVSGYEKIFETNRWHLCSKRDLLQVFTESESEDIIQQTKAFLKSDC